MANGNFGGGNGTKSNPYLIDDGVDLCNVSSFPSAYFKLTRNINLGVHPFNTEKGWNPIRNFSGILDGNGKKISNLYINRLTDDNVGLFANLTNDNSGILKVKNLFVENADIHAHSNVGIIAGNIENAQTSGTVNTAFIENCKVSGKVAGYSYVGGVAGRVSQDTNSSANIHTNTSYVVTVMKNVYVDTKIYADNNNNNFGGVAGGWNNNYSLSSDGPSKMENILSVSTFDKKIQSQEDLSFQPAAFGCDYRNQKMTKCYYDSEKWESNSVTKDSVGLTANKLYKDNEAGFHNIVDDKANAVWGIRKDNYPDLTTFNNKHILIKSNESYYKHKNGVWEKVFDRLPTIDEAEENGMTSNDVRDLGLAEWNSFLTEHSGEDVSVISFENYSEGTNISERLNRVGSIDQAESNSRGKNLFKTSFNFDDLGSNIIYICKGEI